MRIGLLASALLLAAGPAAAQAPVSLPLDSALAMGRAANPGLAIARQRVLEARSRSQERWTNYLPRLTAATTWSLMEDRQRLAIPRGAFGILGTGEPVPGAPVLLPQGGTSLFLHTTRIEQPVTQLFRIRAGHRGAVAEEEAAEARLEAAEGDLSLAITRAYYGLVVAEAQMRAAEARVVADSVAAWDAAGGVAAGLVVSVTAAQAEVRLHQSRQHLLEQRFRLEDQALELADLIDAPASTQFVVAEPADDAPAVHPLDHYLRAAVLANPEVAAAARQVARADQGVAAGRAELLPQVGVYLQHLYQNAVPFLPASQFSIGVRLDWTIWDFGQRSQGIHASRALAAQARLEADRVRRRIESEIVRAHRAVDRAQAGAALAEAAVGMRQGLERQAADQVALGAAPTAALRVAEAARSQAEADLAQARLAVRLALAALERLAGGHHD